MKRMLLAAGFVVLAACEKKPPPPSERAAAVIPTAARVATFNPEQLTPFQPVPPGAMKPVLDESTRLGQMLWFDARLSRGQDVSCNSCHDLGRGGMDNEVVSTGTKGHKTTHNTPTVLNAGASFAQGWDAHATTLEEFVPAHIADVFAAEHVADVVASIPSYAAAFTKAWPSDKLDTALVTRALVTFTKKLSTRARWDRYLEGDATALSTEELGGFAMFVAVGCPTCHQGKQLGAMDAQKLGIAKPWPGSLGLEPGMFKIPTLRNVWRSGPWLHDGSLATLEETTRLMARHQLGRELAAVQVVAITAFLATLDGDPAPELAQKPALPPSGTKTPKPG